MTVEVAEKHDLIMNLKDQVTYLEEQFRQANIQLQFKNNIIKEMRKDLVSKVIIKLIKFIRFDTSSFFIYF